MEGASIFCLPSKLTEGISTFYVKGLSKICDVLNHLNSNELNGNSFHFLF